MWQLIPISVLPVTLKKLIQLLTATPAPELDALVTQIRPLPYSSGPDAQDQSLKQQSTSNDPIQDYLVRHKTPEASN